MTSNTPYSENFHLNNQYTSIKVNFAIRHAKYRQSSASANNYNSNNKSKGKAYPIAAVQLDSLDSD